MEGVRSSHSDIISTLPVHIIENILTRLPLRDAVRTGILSTGWKHKWVTIPDIIFDHQLHPELRGNQNLKTIVYQVLLLHQGPIVKFELSVPDFRSCTDIHPWILHLSKKNIQKFTLGISNGNPYRLPSYLFDFLQLSHLNLHNCVFKPPPMFKGFNRLVSLELSFVVLVPEMFGNLISKFPQLERLKCESCTGFDCLDIDAHKLRFFRFCGSLKSICFKCTPLLAEVSVTLDVEHQNQGKISNLIKFFSDVPAIQKLCLGENSLEFLGTDHVLERPPIMLEHLTYLDLSMHFEKIEAVKCALCLIRSSPNLRNLIIVAFTNPSNNMQSVTEYLQARDFSDCSFNRLEKVQIFCFSGVKPEMEFVKVLLACSTILEKLFFHPRIFEEVLRFPRASPKVEVIDGFC